MGVMRFLVPERTRLAANAAARAYFAGIDEIPWQARVHRAGDELRVERDEFDSGNFFIPYPVEGYGELMLSTGSLMERSAPYHLPVELARGTLNRLRNQLAGWESLGMQTPPALRAPLAQAHEHLSWATTRQQDPNEAARRADLAIHSALQGVWMLSDAYVAQSLGARHQQGGKLSTLLGVNLGGAVPADAVARELSAAFNTVQVPFAWRDIEASEGKRDWRLADQQIEWCRASGFKVCGGPLLDIEKSTMPDWMYLWGEDDTENFRSCAAEHIQAVVSRYRGKVHLWVCAARLNVENDFGHGEDDRLRTAVMAIENIRRADPRSPIVLSIDQPWGSFMSQKECDLSPLHFADALVRAELGLAGIGLEINFGYAPGGTEPRDPLEFGRQIDRFSTLGLPLLVSLVVPSSATADPRAGRTEGVVPYAAGGQLSDATQRAWAETYLGVLLAKQPVQGIIWNQLLDSRPHALAHGGLFDEKDEPKPIVEVIKALKREHLT
jgi:Glycosyl hydrolase family 10